MRNRQKTERDLLGKLAVAQRRSNLGEKGISHTKMIGLLRARVAMTGSKKKLGRKKATTR